MNDQTSIQPLTLDQTTALLSFISKETIDTYIEKLGSEGLNKLLIKCIKKGVPPCNIGIALTYNLCFFKIFKEKHLYKFINDYNLITIKCLFRGREMLAMDIKTLDSFLANPYYRREIYTYDENKVLKILRPYQPLVNDKGIVLEFDERTNEIFNLETFKDSERFALLRFLL